KEYFEIIWAELRAKVEPSFGERSVINHRDYLTNGRIVASAASNITDTEVQTGEGHLIAYDYLVIATGHKDPVPKTRTGRLNQFEAENQKIKSAHSILIVGGGPTGVELAGEISVDFPDKKITLVHKGSRLLEFIGPKASVKAINWLRSRNVEVNLEQSVNLDSIVDGEKSYKTSTGEIIKADCHFLCTGKPLGSAWLKETLLKDNIDSCGRLIVDENLRVKGRRNIFAIGDITDIPEIKQGYIAHNHASVAAKNIKLLMDGGKESKMASYKPASALALVSLGRKDAVAQFPFATISGWIPGMIKARDLFVGKTRKQMGL
ncbi:Pyr_redox_2 domain-containing protein, partial [Cephalotus follicularis]